MEELEAKRQTTNSPGFDVKMNAQQNHPVHRIFIPLQTVLEKNDFYSLKEWPFSISQRLD